MTTINRGTVSGTVIINGKVNFAVYYAEESTEGRVIIRSRYGTSVISEHYSRLSIDGEPVSSAGEAVERLSEFIGNFKSPGSGGGSGSGTPGSLVSLSDAETTEIKGDNAQTVFVRTDREIRALKQAAAGVGTIEHTQPEWEADDLAMLQRWVDTATNTAYDPVNERRIANFDVYLARNLHLVDADNPEETVAVNYYFDSGIWLLYNPPPKAGIGILRAWSSDNATVNVRLSGVPTEAVTASSFDVYNADTGESVAVLACEGAGVDYILTIEQQTADYGITFMGQ